MSEVDRKCNFVAPNGLCLSPINAGKKFCDEVPTEWCYYKQLRQLKEENQKLKDGKTQTTIDFLVQQLARRVEQVKRTTGKLDSVFNFDSDFCETKCCAKDKCNGNCCYEQLREMFGYEQ